MKNKALINKSNSKWVLIFELLIHILQPYPYVSVVMESTNFGNDVNYNINMLFFFFCSLRFYLIIKVVRYYNLFAQHQSKNILKLYEKNSSITTFLYRANLKHNGFMTIGLIGAITLIYSSIIFQIVEYNKMDQTNPFYYLWNCTWYIIVTMCTSNISSKV